MPEISVIVPVYNTERFLQRCIDSILSQTFKNFELILVDDGSTDRSGIICDRFQTIDSRIHVIHQTNAGVSVARNTAIIYSNGKYIFFIDSDDYISNNCLEVLFASIATTHADIAVSAIQMINEQGEIIHRTNREKRVYYDRDIMEHFGSLNDDTFRCTLSKLVPAYFCKEELFPIGRHFAEDLAVVYKWYDKAHCVVEINEAVYNYTIREGSAVHSEYSYKRLGDIDTLEELLDYLKNNKYDKLYEEYFHRYLWTLANNITYIRLKKYDKKIENSLLIKIKKTIKDNCQKASVCRDAEAMNLAYPITMWLYWTWKGIMSKIKKIADD